MIITIYTVYIGVHCIRACGEYISQNCFIFIIQLFDVFAPA